MGQFQHFIAVFSVSYRNVCTNLHLLGQPDTPLDQARVAERDGDFDVRRRRRGEGHAGDLGAEGGEQPEATAVKPKEVLEEVQTPSETVL